MKSANSHLSYKEVLEQVLLNDCSSHEYQYPIQWRLNSAKSWRRMGIALSCLAVAYLAFALITAVSKGEPRLPRLSSALIFSIGSGFSMGHATKAFKRAHKLLDEIRGIQQNSQSDKTA